MIRGEINQNGDACVKIPILDADGSDIDVATVIDTGFDGMITIPPSLAAMLGAVPKSHGAAMLADGTICRYDLYEVKILWGGVEREIIGLSVGDEPLLGMRLLADHELRMQVIPNGLVEISKI